MRSTVFMPSVRSTLGLVLVVAVSSTSRATSHLDAETPSHEVPDLSSSNSLHNNMSLLTLEASLHQIEADLSRLEVDAQQQEHQCVWWMADASRAMIRARCMFVKQRPESDVTIFVKVGDHSLVPLAFEFAFGSSKCRGAGKRRLPDDPNEPVRLCTIRNIPIAGPMTCAAVLGLPRVPESVAMWQEQFTLVFEESISDTLS